MVYIHNYGVVKQKLSLAGLLIIAGLFAFMASIGIFTKANAASINGCSFTVVGSTWSLDGDCNSTSQINLPTGITLEGNGYTISPTFSRTSNDNNSVIGILASNVTVQNLVIDGTSGTSLHGVNIYVASGVTVSNTIVKNNDRSGIVVNGSVVTVNNINTSGNGWHGINVDLGSGVVGPALLTVTGVSAHTELLQIYVDNTAEAVSVNDVNSQYNITNNVIKNGDRVYTLKPQPKTATDCKKGGWEVFGFKNQGLCIQYINTGKDSRVN